MGAFDQAARYATQADPEAVCRRLVRSRGDRLRFRDWMDPRSLPWPGSPERTADLVAILDDPAATPTPWLLVLEFQAQVVPDKLDVTLEEVALLRGRLRHGDDRKGKYAGGRADLSARSLSGRRVGHDFSGRHRHPPRATRLERRGG